MNPTISIIIPVYNQEKYLSRCLDSILAQTFTDFEVVCVNDHSTDNTENILKEYVKKDSRIKTFDDPGKGAADARNFGIEKASGEYVGFVDSDDFIQPQMYEFLLRAITENNCDMVACGYEETSDTESKLFEYSCRECDPSEFAGDAYNWGKDEMILSGVWSKLVKKDLLKTIDKFENYRVGEDTLFCANLWTNANKTLLVNLPLYLYFKNSQSVTQKIDDERYLCLIETRYKAFKIYKQKYRKLSNYYLFKGILLIFRCKNENIFDNSDSKKKASKLFKKMFIPFVITKGITLNEKFIKLKKYLFG